MKKGWQILTKGRRPEWITWGFFIALLLFAMHMHEPWFDEIQAWFIAKDAPWHDLLWVLPHYEGHPPFFHLLLAIPARLGISGRLGLHCIGALFSIASAYLIIFKSPFPRVARLTLPFSYFLFYQYSVIVRPYNIMVFLMCLLAVYFPQKDKRPGLFVLLLAALCACHLYGIAIAGGIAIAWLWEMKSSLPWKNYFKNLLHDRRFYWLLGLLGWAIALLLWIMPRPDAFAMGNEFQVNSLWQRAIYLLFVMPADAFVTDIFYFSLQRLSVAPIPYYDLTCGTIAGLLIWASVFSCLSKKARPFLWIPCLCLLIPLMYYMRNHHIGLIGLVIIWALWIGWEYRPKYPKHIKAFYLLLLLYPLGWTVASLYDEIRYPQLSGKPFLQFLQEHQLEHKRIFALWELEKAEDLLPVQQVLHPDGIENTFHVPLATILNFYASYNLFANLNETTRYRYNTHIVATPEINKQMLQAWRQVPPDLMVGAERLERLFEDHPEKTREYAIVYRIDGHRKWKFNKLEKTRIPVWARLELIEPHHLAPQDTLFFFIKSLKG